MLWGWHVVFLGGYLIPCQKLWLNPLIASNLEPVSHGNVTPLEFKMLTSPPKKMNIWHVVFGRERRVVFFLSFCWSIPPFFFEGSTLARVALEWWYPITMGFPTKNDHFGVFWRYHHLRKHPSPFSIGNTFSKGPFSSQLCQFSGVYSLGRFRKELLIWTEKWPSPVVSKSLKGKGYDRKSFPKPSGDSWIYPDPNGAPYGKSLKDALYTGS